MDDLISKNSVYHAIEDEWTECCSEYSSMQIIHDTEAAIDRIPSVPAVPLDKLCKWLQENALLSYKTPLSVAGWKYELTQWMEEQNAAD